MNYRTSYHKPAKKHPKHRPLTIMLLLLVLGSLLGGYIYFALHRSLPQLQPSTSALNLRIGTGTSQLNWPATGQSAVGVLNTPILQVHGTQSPAPIASVAKVITALAVLQKYPLAMGQSGPTISLTAADAALYDNYVAQGGSVVPVSAGEQITERQMLEAMMLPSANNMADSLAIWAFGSLDAYRSFASQYVMKLGMRDTQIGSDASGFSPTTTSTARDLVIIGEQAMQNALLRQIVGQVSSTDVPMTNSVSNVNFLLGRKNIIGIKTGNTDQAGGVYLSASTTIVDHQTETVITALVGAPTLSQALEDSLPLIASAQANFVSASLLAQHAVVGEYNLPWGGVLPAIAQDGLITPAWRGSTATAHASLKPIDVNARADQVVGTAVISSNDLTGSHQTTIILQNAPSPPPILWRLLHPIQ